MKKRLLTFGCSFTNYVWPTWADVLAQDFDQFENWGRIGSGNHFILYSLAEAIHRSKITKDDTIAVMFTSFAREDRWIKGYWVTPGSVYHSGMSANHIDSYNDPDGFVITNLAVIDSVIRIIQGLGCNYLLMSTVPPATIDDSYLGLKFKFTQSADSLYRQTLDQIKPSVYETIFNNDWNSRDNILIPRARFNVLKDFCRRYQECAGPDWPKFDNFLMGKVDDIKKSILQEIDEQFDFYAWHQKINTKRQDQHPTPLEHLEYLKLIGNTTTTKQTDFANHWNQIVLEKEIIGWKSQKIKRF